MKKGKLPITERITLSTDETQWRLLTRGLVNEIPSEGIIQLSTTKKAKIQLVFETIYPPENKISNNSITGNSNLGQTATKGLERCHNFLMNFLDRNSWTFIGYIDGENKIPIVVIYFPAIDLAIYSQKLSEETTNEFLPNPQLN